MDRIHIDAEGAAPEPPMIRFLLQVRAVLDSAVSDALLLFPEGTAYMVESGWSEAAEDLEELMRVVRALSESELQRVGLSGRQLDNKLTGFARARAKYEEAKASENPHRVRKWFVRVASWINSILGSLLKALPIGSPGEILKEFKEKLENLAEDRIAEDELG